MSSFDHERPANTPQEVLRRTRYRVSAGCWRPYFVEENTEERMYGCGCFMQLMLRIPTVPGGYPGPLNDEACELVRDHLEAVHNLVPAISAWNDSNDRTPEDVMALIDEVLAANPEQSS